MFRKAAAEGDADAMVRMGWYAQTGDGVSRDEPLARHWYEKAAKAGNVDGMRLLASTAETGTGAPRNYPTAVHWYGNAAALGDPESTYRLASLEAKGSGTPMDPQAAATNMRRAAVLGHLQAMRELGLYLSKGFGTTRNDSEANAWIRRAAEGGDSTAMVIWGKRLETGEGERRDIWSAARWYRRSAAERNVAGALNCGHLFYFGAAGVAANHAQGARCWRIAADAGSGEAMYALATMADRENRDGSAAYYWMQRSASVGFDKAKHQLDRGAQRESSRFDIEQRIRLDTADAQRAIIIRPPFRRADPSSVIHGPSPLQILLLSTRLKAREYGWAMTAVPGELIVSGPSSANLRRYRRAISNLDCRRISVSTFRCDYDQTVWQERISENRQTLLADAFPVRRTENPGKRFSIGHWSYDFSRVGSGWTSPQFAAAIRSEGTRNREMAATGTSAKPDMGEEPHDLLAFPYQWATVGNAGL
jgi:TPR repeat protein